MKFAFVVFLPYFMNFCPLMPPKRMPQPNISALCSLSGVQCWESFSFPCLCHDQTCVLVLFVPKACCILPLGNAGLLHSCLYLCPLSAFSRFFPNHRTGCLGKCVDSTGSQFCLPITGCTMGETPPGPLGVWC